MMFVMMHRSTVEVEAVLIANSGDCRTQSITGCINVLGLAHQSRQVFGSTFYQPALALLVITLLAS
jgi:hypothetical protein